MNMYYIIIYITLINLSAYKYHMLPPIHKFLKKKTITKGNQKQILNTCTSANKIWDASGRNIKCKNNVAKFITQQSFRQPLLSFCF